MYVLSARLYFLEISSGHQKLQCTKLRTLNPDLLECEETSELPQDPFPQNQ